MAKIKKEEAEAIDFLRGLFLKSDKIKYPNIPDFARITPKYRTSDSKGLLKAISHYIEFSGGRITRTAHEKDNCTRITIRYGSTSSSVRITPNTNLDNAINSLSGFITWYSALNKAA